MPHWDERDDWTLAHMIFQHDEDQPMRWSERLLVGLAIVTAPLWLLIYVPLVMVGAWVAHRRHRPER